MVRQDLEDFKIPCDFREIKSKSKDAFKRLVKIKAKEFALKILTTKQQKHSKMENIVYPELKRQNYFSMRNISVEQARNIFKYRVRMAAYEENFRGNRASVACPLCHLHLDNQAMSFQCNEIRTRVQIKCDMNDIYTNDITLETACTITEITRTRESLMKQKKSVNGR